MRIGVVDLDTSHPEAFLPLLRERGHDVVAVYGGHTVVDDDYTRRYATENGIARVVDDLTELVGDVDAVFVHGVDWDTHLARVRLFAGHGIPVHLCKPFAGRAADVREMVALAADGARITGGSALRWSAAVAEWRAREERADTGLAVTYGHPLDYGVHAFSLLHGFHGPGIEAARALDAEGRRVELRWRDGRTGVVIVQPAGEGYGFFATLVSVRGVHHVEAGGADLYARLLDATLAHLVAPGPPEVSLAELVEPELAVLAGRASAENSGQWVRLHDDPAIDGVAFDGAEFAVGYRLARRKALGLSVDAP